MSTASIDAECIVACGNTLGESVFWSAALQTVFWIDGTAPAIWQWHAQTRSHKSEQFGLSGAIGMIAATKDHNVLAMARPSGIVLFDLTSRRQAPVAAPESGRAGIGYNDAKVDPMGRLWLGTYDESEIEPRGCLWLLDNGRVPRLLETGMAVVNGPAFSPDGAVVYVSDSVGRRILAFDVQGAALSRRRVFAQLTPEEGLPDGLTVDAKGGVWCAHWDGARVTRFSPDGERLLRIAIPASRVTSVAFGGAALDMLFITTARYGLTEAQLASSPQAGSLFGVRPGVRGLAPGLLPLPFRTIGIQ